MTFDDDMARLNLSIATPMVPLKTMGLEWPPPERLYIGEGGAFREAIEGDEPVYVMRRISMSAITDEQRAEMTHVFRGAEYVYEKALEAEEVSA